MTTETTVKPELGPGADVSRSLLGAHEENSSFPRQLPKATKGAPCSSAIWGDCCARTVSQGTTAVLGAVEDTTEPSESERGHTGRDRVPCS